MATRKEKRIAELIKKVDTIHFADREMRGKLEDQIEGPFPSGLFTFADDQSAVNAAIAEYKSQLTELDSILSNSHPLNKLSPKLKNSYQVQMTHYSNMIDLLS